MPVAVSAASNAADGALVLRDGLVLGVARIEVAVRVEDFGEQVQRRLVGERREVRADGGADAFEGWHAEHDLANTALPRVVSPFSARAAL